MNVEDARQRWHEAVWVIGVLSEHGKLEERDWLLHDVYSLDLDNATAAQYAEYRGPHPTFLRQPEA